jgi:hypothetical protein
MAQAGNGPMGLRFFPFARPSLQSLTRIAQADCAPSDECDFSLYRPDSSSGTLSSNPGFGCATASALPPGSLGSPGPWTASPSATSSCGSFDIQDRCNTAAYAPQDGDENVSYSTGTASPYPLPNGWIWKSIEDHRGNKIDLERMGWNKSMTDEND